MILFSSDIEERKHVPEGGADARGLPGRLRDSRESCKGGNSRVTRHAFGSFGEVNSLSTYYCT
jgi:hypothetical protein